MLEGGPPGGGQATEWTGRAGERDCVALMCEDGLCLAHQCSLQPLSFLPNMLKADPSSHGDLEARTEKGDQW